MKMKLMKLSQQAEASSQAYEDAEQSDAPNPAITVLHVGHHPRRAGDPYRWVSAAVLHT